MYRAALLRPCGSRPRRCTLTRSLARFRVPPAGARPTRNRPRLARSGRPLVRPAMPFHWRAGNSPEDPRRFALPSSKDGPCRARRRVPWTCESSSRVRRAPPWSATMAAPRSHTTLRDDHAIAGVEPVSSNRGHASRKQVPLPFGAPECDARTVETPAAVAPFPVGTD